VDDEHVEQHARPLVHHALHQRKQINDPHAVAGKGHVVEHRRVHHRLGEIGDAHRKNAAQEAVHDVHEEQFVPDADAIDAYHQAMHPVGVVACREHPVRGETRIEMKEVEIDDSPRERNRDQRIEEIAPAETPGPEQPAQFARRKPFHQHDRPGDHAGEAQRENRHVPRVEPGVNGCKRENRYATEQDPEVAAQARVTLACGENRGDEPARKAGEVPRERHEQHGRGAESGQRDIGGT